MTVYPVTLPCPLTQSDTSAAEKTSTRTEFDYRSRLKRIPRRRLIFQISFNCTDTQLDTFLTFYETIELEGFIFQADWSLQANDNVEKVLRVTSTPVVKDLAGLRYNITFSTELMAYGLPNARPLVPSEGLFPSEFLLPG